MIIRRGFIVVLTILLIGIVVFRFVGIRQSPQPLVVQAAIDPANVTVVAAPEQTASMENPAFIKEVYVPVLPEGTNIALEGKVFASSIQDSFAARKSIDGKSEGASYWEGKANTYPNILTLDLKKVASIHAVRLTLNPLSVWGKRTQTFAVQVSGDGTNFEELVPMTQYTFDPDQGNEVIVEFEGMQTQYVQLEFTENSGAGGAQVAEFEVYSE
ncbi:MAG: discoidin domain-containing protein [Vallitaleaceae bacterium]|nr:discoidin domain-containing protein [Vallitaleaceae bacterium]